MAYLLSWNLNARVFVHILAESIPQSIGRRMLTSRK